MEITFHRLGHGNKSVPAVNVKIHKSIHSIALPREEFSPQFTHGWIEKNLNTPEENTTIDGWWNEACREGWEELDTIAFGIYGERHKVYSEGRSAGWAYIDGLKAYGEWGEEDFTKWGQFSEQAQTVAKDIPYQTVALIYYNVFLPLGEEQEEAEGRTRP